MSESFLVYLAFVVILIIGIRTSWTDCKYKKVFNRDLFIFLPCVAVVQISYMFVAGLKGIVLDILCIIGSMLLSFGFYYLRIWAAGDAKLFCVISLGIPWPLFTYTIGELPPVLLLGGIFSIAFFYVIIESILYFFRDFLKGDIRFQRNEFTLRRFGITAIMWFLGYGAISLFNILAMSFSEYEFTYQKIVLIFADVMVVTILLNEVNTIKKSIWAVCTVWTLRMVVAVFQHSISSLISPVSIATVVVISLMRALTNRYNYREIPTALVKPGMVLAMASLPAMLVSKVQGLPKTTDETTHSRLTEDEVCAIQRWKSSRYGQETVIIVRHIPFAPFIISGTLLFLIFQYIFGV